MSSTAINFVVFLYMIYHSNNKIKGIKSQLYFPQGWYFKISIMTPILVRKGLVNLCIKDCDNF